MLEPRTIKKYPNRRLYDTVESRYITLGDVRKLVIDHVDFIVLDKKSQDDITNSILLQVIADQEHGSEPMMSREFLSQLIRSYGVLSRAEPETVRESTAGAARARQERGRRGPARGRSRGRAEEFPALAFGAG